MTWKSFLVPTVLLFSVTGSGESRSADQCELLARVTTSVPFQVPLSAEILRCGTKSDIDVTIDATPRVSRHLSGSALMSFEQALEVVHTLTVAIARNPAKPGNQCAHPIGVQTKWGSFRACPETDGDLVGRRIFEIANSVR